MPELSPAARALARRVLLHDAGGRREPVALTEAAARANARLRARLVDVVGLAGYAALVARAVRLAQAEGAARERVTADEGVDGSPRTVPAAVRASDGDPTGRAGDGDPAAILAHVIGLLITFIGEDLALRLVREAWPEVAPDHLASEGRA